MNRILGLFVAVLSFTLGASSVNAATLNVVGGQLLGASGVIVDGSSYNVEFLDGTCIALYDGCDEVSDFTFQTDADAVMASQALVDQVFLDGAFGSFNSSPELTNGCEMNICSANSPYGFTGLGGGIVDTRGAVNTGAGGAVFPAGAVTPDQDLTANISQTFAVWSPVPEPGTAVLMGLGLLALGTQPGRRS